MRLIRSGRRFSYAASVIFRSYAAGLIRPSEECRGAAKRFKKTATGKFTRSKAFKRHILTSKTTKSKRQMRGSEVVHAADTPRLKKMLPYD